MRGLFSSRGLAIVAVSVISLIGGCLLAWWQWTRFESASGTLQNLGYVLQWPLFGIFPAFMFYRIYRSAQRERAERAVEDGTAEVEQPVEVPRQRSSRAERDARQRVTEERAAVEWTARRSYTQNRDTGVGAAGEDGELVAYNKYLARLNAAEERDAD
jgi:DNA-binding transcriptional regulator of glucitol operon